MRSTILNKPIFFVVLICIAISISCISCESFKTPSIATFREPQPIGKKALEQFPSNLLGRYQSMGDGSIINIQPKYITRIYDHWSVIKDSISDMQIEYIGDTKNVSKKYYPIKGNDSVKVHFYSNDTIFFINNNHVVKNFKGSCFLNTRLEDTIWTVKQLSLEKDKLTLGGIASEDDLNKLGQATSTAIDTTKPQNFQPTKREFKTFVKAEGFSELEVFRKIK